MAVFARIELHGAPQWVRVEGEALLSLPSAPWASPSPAAGERVGARGDASLKWLPVSPASKVVAIGQNYRKHAEEMGKPVPAEPLIFTKPSTALNAHRSPIVLPPASAEVHHEAELALVIGRTLKRASLEEAAAGIFALTCFNDVTARDIQRRETQHTRAKGYDTFACCGPVMVSGLPPDDLRIQCRVNGVTRQDSRTSDMVHTSAALVAFISQIMTLLPGDLISTGTPSGVGPLRAGDSVEVDIEGIGTLENPVV